MENIRAKKVRKEKNKDERKRKSENEKGKIYRDFNWVELYENNTVKKAICVQSQFQKVFVASQNGLLFKNVQKN